MFSLVKETSFRFFFTIANQIDGGLRTMDNHRYEHLSSLFEVVSSLERKWANEWNQKNH